MEKAKKILKGLGSFAPLCLCRKEDRKKYKNKQT